MPTLVLKVVVAMVTTATLNTVKFITRGNSNNVDNDSHEHDEDHEPEKDCIKKKENNDHQQHCHCQHTLQRSAPQLHGVNGLTAVRGRFLSNRVKNAAGAPQAGKGLGLGCFRV